MKIPTLMEEGTWEKESLRSQRVLILVYLNLSPIYNTSSKDIL